MKLPVINVSLVHIQGPLKGEIQQLSQNIIRIGRHPRNDVSYPADMTEISRHHAEIERDGNFFRLADKSTNGTFVNGNKVTDIILKDGDVIEFTPGGPKVSFLTEMCVEPDPAHQPMETNAAETKSRVLLSDTPSLASISNSFSPNLIIQYGPFIRSFKEFPVTIGRDSRSSLVFGQTGLLGHHAQIFYHHNQYWIKNMTGQSIIHVNAEPVTFQAAFSVNDLLSLGPDGPCFRCVGEGKLAEAEKGFDETDIPECSDKNQNSLSTETVTERFTNSEKSLFSKLKERLLKSTDIKKKRAQR